ncbi:hypothetical protein [Acinetobacter phage ABPH49]|nr:hypothetical protein [Acinetobacter phage ABPH49]
MFTIETRADVIAIARTFGPAALAHAVNFGTLRPEACQVIRDCQNWAMRETVLIEEVNDGNREYTIEAVFSAKKFGNEYYTGFEEIRIVRYGFSPFDLSVQAAMENRHISRISWGEF